MYKWFSEEKDARFEIQQNILARIQEHEVASVIMSNNLLGCPHQEEIDYPLGQSCPHCPYWKDKDRFASFLSGEP